MRAPPPPLAFRCCCCGSLSRLGRARAGTRPTLSTSSASPSSCRCRRAPRTWLLEAIGQRKDNRAANVKKKSNIAEQGLKGLYHALWKREDVDEALLSEELAYLDKRRDERDKAIILFRQAQVHHEEKREWYRFVYNHTKTEEEFNEIVQTESLASYKRLMLGLDDEMEENEVWAARQTRLAAA